MISESPDYCDILGVKREASNEELHAAYKRLALKHHPDKNKGNEEIATAKFQEVQKAFEALRDPETRLKENTSEDAPCSPKAATAASTNSSGENPFAWFDQNWGPNFGRRWNDADWRRDTRSKVGTTDWFDERGRKPSSSSFATQHPGFGVFSRFFTHLPPLPPLEVRLDHHRHNCDWRESKRFISIRVM
ncbi:DnaJ domain-containing protein [Nemania diffusa]|nr:DnaJ domain-containing protein [Nemania diffusa]